MISITCTQCRTVLTIDEAFAGGVCRCQHCGTIQTVPAQLKPSATPAPFAGPSATTSKSLYQNKAGGRSNSGNIATTGSSSPSGLDDLAQAVASSGLSGSGSGLRSGGLAGNTASAGPMPPTPEAQLATPVDSPRKKAAQTSKQAGQQAATKLPMVPIAIGGGALLLAIVGTVLFFIFHSGGGGGTSGGGHGPAGTFCGATLSGSSVIYVLDRASSIRNDFDDLKAATYQSIQSLGPDGKFAVILWNNGGSDVAFPTDGLRNATSDQMDLLKNAMEVQATGASKLAGGLQRAMGRNPTSIVIVTGKAKLDEDDEDALATIKETAAGKVKFYAFALNMDNSSFKIAAGPNFEYKKMTSRDLHAATP